MTSLHRSCEKDRLIIWVIRCQVLRRVLISRHWLDLWMRRPHEK